MNIDEQGTVRTRGKKNMNINNIIWQFLPDLIGGWAIAEQMYKPGAGASTMVKFKKEPKHYHAQGKIHIYFLCRGKNQWRAARVLSKQGILR